MITSKTRTLNYSFVLDADALRRLAGLLKAEVLDRGERDEGKDKDREVEYSVELSDGSTISTKDVNDVLDLPNSPRRAITSIKLSTPYSFRTFRASIRLRNDDTIPVTYDLTGEDREVVALSDKLEENLSGLRQWYTFMNERFIFPMMAAMAMIVVLILSGLTVADIAFPELRDSARSLSRGTKTIAALFILIPVLVPFLLMTFLAFFSGSLFPYGTFAIGQGVQRQSRRRNVRNIVLTCILLPVPVGIVVNMIS